jgi:hypothetical protein
LRLEAFDRPPVVSRRREHIDDDGTIRTDVDFVRRVWRDPPGSTGAEIANLAADAKRERSLEDDAELLVLVAVLRDHALWIELDHRKTDAITVHGTSENAFPDSERVGSGKIVERAHAFLLGFIASNLTDRALPAG